MQSPIFAAMKFDNKIVLLVGGTGSFGVAFLRYLLSNHSEIRQVRIMSRDEQKQYELSNTLTDKEKLKVSLFVGDIRDKDRVYEIADRVDIIIHAAAMKHVAIAESNIMECFKTNVIGTQNLVEAALHHKVECFVALSTDKAVMPINSYGASKLYLERLVTSAQESFKNVQTKFCVVRYANVLGSRGSVVPYFLRIRESGELTITDFRMTRFSITMTQAIDIVKTAMLLSRGGEIFVPKAPSYEIMTVAEAVAPQCKIREIGARQGEKISELMVSKFEAARTIERADCYVILSTAEHVGYRVKDLDGKLVQPDFEYDSATNSNWLTVAELQSQIKKLA